jgi:hypothetical protein
MIYDNGVTGTTPVERRTHHAVRKIFVEACVLLAPFVRGNDRILNMSNFAMLHVVQYHFPGLSGPEAHIVITTVERLNRDGRLQTLIVKEGGA